MADGSRLKVALLARAGDAREQLKRAITELGAVLVVEADPNELAPGALAAAGATTVLVSVEPAVEAALDRLEDDLLASALNVMYDEAGTTSRLQGWDLNRWARHLAAKLIGCDVLPPGGADPVDVVEEAADHLQPGAPVRPDALASAARIDDFAEEISASAAEVPSAYRPSDAPLAPAPTEADPAPAAWAAPALPEGDPHHLDLDLDALEQAMRLPSAAPSDEAQRVAAPAAFALEADLDIAAIDLRGLELVDDAEAGTASPPRITTPSVSLLSAKEIELDGSGFDGFDGLDAGRAASTGNAAPTPVDTLDVEVEELTLTEDELAAFADLGAFDRASSRPAAAAVDEVSLEMDDDLARLAAALDERLDEVSFEPAGSELDDHADLQPPEVSASPARAEPPPIPDIDHLSLGGETLPGEPAPVVPSPPKPGFDFSAIGRLELAPLDEALPAPSPPPVPVDGPHVDVGHLSLSPLVDDADAAAAAGVVLVLSGIGGPDAVRQMVRALPAGFPLAVLLRQNLDGGRHDRLVEQLAKISRLPVALAEPQETPPPNAVRVLPEGIASAGALSFPASGGVAALIEAVAPLDGAIVVLSGAEEAAIEPLRQAMAAGLRVIVQDPASCFDPKVVLALRDAGAPTVAAADLAARLDAYFPT